MSDTPDTLPPPSAWMESPHGAIRANPLHRWTAPHSLAWQIALHDEFTVRRLIAERDERIRVLTDLLREAHDTLHIVDNRCELSDIERYLAANLQERIRAALGADHD